MNTWFTSTKVNISLGKTIKSQENTLQEYLLTIDANGLQLYLSGGFYHRTSYEVTNFKSTTSLFYEVPTPCLRIGDYCAFIVLFSPLNCWLFWSCDGVHTICHTLANAVWQCVWHSSLFGLRFLWIPFVVLCLIHSRICQSVLLFGSLFLRHLKSLYLFRFR